MGRRGQRRNRSQLAKERRDIKTQQGTKKQSEQQRAEEQKHAEERKHADAQQRWWEEQTRLYNRWVQEAKDEEERELKAAKEEEREALEAKNIALEAKRKAAQEAQEADRKAAQEAQEAYRKVQQSQQLQRLAALAEKFESIRKQAEKQYAAYEAGLLLEKPCSLCNSTRWLVVRSEGDASFLLCCACDTKLHASRDEIAAINLGLTASTCSKCLEEVWSFVSISPNRRAATWRCKYCGKAEMVTGAASTTTCSREPIPTTVQREVWRRDQGRCVTCGSQERLEFDHTIPVSKGGSNTARNIQLLCESCNRTKSNRI